MEPKALLVDASSLIYRAFFSTPDTVKAPGGMQVNAAHGFINMLARLVADRDPDLLACGTDVDWRPQWRVDLIPGYKTHRLDLPAVPQLDAQMPLIEELVAACGVAVVGCPGYEAEDVIGALVPRCPGKVEIVSGDRDLFQLVRDPDVAVLYPKRGVTDMVTVDEAYVADKYGIPGRAYGDFALLRGDTSDGLPGVPGIGEKTAALLIARYGSLQAVIEEANICDGAGALGKVKKSLDYLRKASSVVMISADIPLPEVELARPRTEPGPEVYEKAEQYGLRNAVTRLVAALTQKVQTAG